MVSPQFPVLRTFLVLLCALGMTSTVICQSFDENELYEERTWRGKNGGMFKGRFSSYIESEDKYVFSSFENTFFIAAENLSDEDLEFIKRGLAKKAQDNQPEAPRAVPEQDGIKPDPNVNRGAIPIVDQGKFGMKASDCVPSSFCTFLLWWDQTGLIAIPEKGDEDDKLEWVHDRMARYCGTRNNSGTSGEEFVEGVMRYFSSDLKENADFKYGAHPVLSQKQLSQLTQGHRAVMLELTCRYNEQDEFSHWVALKEAKEDGTLTFITWGRKIQVRMEIDQQKRSLHGLNIHQRRLSQNEEIRPKLAFPETTPGHAPSWKLKIQDENQLPEFYQNSDLRLSIDPEGWDFVHIVDPAPAPGKAPK